MEKRKIGNMEGIRKPFQGVTNIIRFNWHFYLLAGLLMLSLCGLVFLSDSNNTFYLIGLCYLIGIVIALSLTVSFYIYDLSPLYSLNWLDKIHSNQEKIININAGFDETSPLLKAKYPNSKLTVYDFYDPLKHTEVSIKRARRAYPPYPDTLAITTSSMPIEDGTIDTAYILFSAHEIRDEGEKVRFFKEVNRVLASSGKLIVTEHLRDLPNFFAYNVGFLHFYSRISWLKTFKKADLKICGVFKITPFITTFILEKNGTTS